MKRGFRKSLALLLAVFMAFGVAPFFAVGMIASAADPELVSITLSVASEIEMVAGEQKTLSVVATYNNSTSKFIDADKVAFSSSDSKLVKIESDGTLNALAPTEEGKPVSVKAFYSENEKTVFAETKVTVTKAPIYVDSIAWNWDVTALLAGTDKVYSFADLYKVVPDNADDKTAKLTCTPESALQIDNEEKTFKVNPITTDKLVVTLTLTPNKGSDKCQPATKQVTLYNDVPLKSIEWDYKVGSTGKSLFKYYETVSGIQQVAEYYYELTDGKTTTRKFHTDPAYAVDLCDITVKSEDKRIVTFDEVTKRLIPVGNGEAKITITAKTPKGVVKSHTIIAVVQDSPYTPVTSVAIGYDKNNTDSDASYDAASNTLTLLYTHSIQLTANLNDKAKLDQKAISVTMSDGRKVTTVAECEHSWKSSDETVATVDKNGKVTVTGAGTATITLTVNDNGTVLTKDVKVQGKMSWWEALVGILMSLFSGRWNKIPAYFKAMFGSF